MAKKDKGVLTGNPVTYQIPGPAGGVRIETFIPWTLVKRGVKKQVITPLDAPERFQAEAEVERRKRQEDVDTPLLRALGLAHYWHQLLDEGKFRSITEIAAAERVDVGQASRIARLTQLSPEIIEAGIAGVNTPSLKSLLRRSFPADWIMQKPEMLPADG